MMGMGRKLPRFLSLLPEKNLSGKSPPNSWQRFLKRTSRVSRLMELRNMIITSMAPRNAPYETVLRRCVLLDCPLESQRPMARTGAGVCRYARHLPFLYHGRGIDRVSGLLQYGQSHTTNGPAMLAFYRDVLGFVHEGDIAMEHVGIKVMHRLWFGKSLIKLVVPVQGPKTPPAPGGIQGGTGYRYWTMTIHNLDEVLSAVQAAGRKIVRPRTEVRPGVVIGMVEDPDGNWVEFIQAP